MYHTIFLTVRVVVDSDYQTVSATLSELEKEATFGLGDTPKVRVQDIDILATRLKSFRKSNGRKPIRS